MYEVATQQSGEMVSRNTDRNDDQPAGSGSAGRYGDRKAFSKR